MSGFLRKIVWGDGITPSELAPGVVRVDVGAAVSATPAVTRTVVTASGTYTTPSGCRAILVECIGGGGGGGGTPATTGSGNGQTAAGGGGGGGAYAASLITTPASSYSVTVGAGGTGVSGDDGNDGGDTIFGSNLVVAEGGIAAPVAVADIGVFPDPSGSAARGGLSQNCTGDLTISGGIGGGGIVFRDAYPHAGGGGGAARGWPGRPQGPANDTFAGNGGLQYGGGGSGATAIASAAAQKGGDGAAGVVIVTEYY